MANKQYKVGIYMRLSKEQDNENNESDSIVNQRDLIYKYIDNLPEMKVIDEYVDDGWSGGNFNRPEITRLLEDIKKKKIDCIIVKDLSRFGRNYIEVGDYLEQIFPFLGIRFIAINDHYDTLNTTASMGKFEMSFKNLINDFYRRDIAKKVKSGYKAKILRGEYISQYAIYGYKKSDEDKNKLVKDEKAAPIVKKIFNLRIEGVSIRDIARILNRDKILTPRQYRQSIKNKQLKGVELWSANTISHILKDERYTGTLVQGKTENITGTNKIRKIPQEEWIRIRGTHEAI